LSLVQRYYLVDIVWLGTGPTKTIPDMRVLLWYSDLYRRTIILICVGCGIVVYHFRAGAYYYWIIHHAYDSVVSRYLHIGGGTVKAVFAICSIIISPFFPFCTLSFTFPCTPPPRTYYYHPTHSVTRRPLTTTTPLSPCQPNILANVVKQIISSKSG